MTQMTIQPPGAGPAFSRLLIALTLSLAVTLGLFFLMQSLIVNSGPALSDPPVGSVLFVGAAIGRIPITEALKSIWPFFLAALTVLLLVTFIPELSLTLPALWRH